MSFEGGFLYVAPQLTENAAAFYVDETGTMVEKNIPHCDLFIWPQMFSETKFCVTLYEETSSVSCMVDRLSEEVICGITVFIIKESDTEFSVSFRKDEIIYSLFSDGYDELEVRRILYSMFE